MRNKKRIIAFIITLSISSTAAVSAFAHSGRTDSNGGHWNRKTGTYHYHNGGSAYKSSSSSTSKIISSNIGSSSKYSTDLIIKIQNRLNQLGYNAGQDDGIMGPNTIRAIKNFQSDRNLVADGIPGPKTQNELFK